MSNQTSEWNRSRRNSTNDTKDEHIKIVDSEHFYNLHHGDQRVAESIVGGGDHSSQPQGFSLPREAAATSKNEQESRDADLSTARGVGNLLSTKLSTSMNSETNSERSYAFVSDFPPPQDTAKAADDGPKSMGVGDLLHHTNDVDHNAEHQDPTIPPHPERSFANVAGDNNIPSSESSSTNNGADKDEKEKHEGVDPSSSTEEFPSPQEASALLINEAKNRGVDLSSTGVGDLLNQKASPSTKLETNSGSYAFVTDFPPPQKASKLAHDTPKSMGVGDLLHHTNDVDHNAEHQDLIISPHPERSFANVAGNNNIPSSESSSTNNGADKDEKEKHEGVDPSSSTEEFPLPQEASAMLSNEAKNRGVDLSSTGVGDLLNQKVSPSTKLETNSERSYAFVTDFPPPQKASKLAHDTPKSMGVGDLFHHTNDVDHNKEQREHLDPTIPPHPQRSFANVAGNKDFPSLSPSSTNNSVSTALEEQESTESLSKIPDVKDMLGSTSVKVKPPPSSQSFAKMAAKAPPSDDKPSPRTIALEKQNQALKNQPDSTTDPSAVTHENFPTLAQANQMFEQGVSVNDKKEKAMFTEISKISDAAEAVVTVDSADEGLDVSKENKGEGEMTLSSFANVTSNNLDKAPPSASPRPVPNHPEYDEQTMMNESIKREVRKSKQADSHEDTVTPEQVLLQERKDEINIQKRNEAMVVSKCIERFDKSRQGKFTMLDTFKTLCGMGYSFISAIPITVLMHLRLSPLTSPYPLPFLYRSITDWFTLPIYTNKLVPALAYEPTRSLLTGKRGAVLVNRYGRQQHGTNNIGLTFWDGIRGMNKEERLGWWQVSSWAVHRLQWMVVYTILQDPKSHLVTADALSGLPSYSTSL